MKYKVNRFVVSVPADDSKTSTDQLDMDFFLQKEQRKVILGTVRFPDGSCAPCSVVKFFKLKDDNCDAENTEELEPIGQTITDDNGQFLLGPVYPGEKIVLKIFCMEDSIRDEEADESVRGTLEPGEY